MKKSTILILLILFASTILYSFRYHNYYKVLGIENSANIFIDLNKNGQIDENEIINIYGVQPFTPNNIHSFTYKDLKFKQYNSVYLAYYSKKWTENKLLNKYIKLKLTAPNQAIVYISGTDYASELLKNGYAIPLNIKDSKYTDNFDEKPLKLKLKEAKKEHYVIYNRKNKKYHELNCRYGLMVNGYEIVPLNKILNKSEPCKICHRQHTKINKIAYSNTNKNVSSNKSFGNLKVFFLDFSNTKKPLNDCNTYACQSLLNQINASKYSIDFAIYGIYKQPKIYDALINAYKKGIKIRWVTDIDADGNYYQDTQDLMKVIPNYKTDDVFCNGKSVKKSIMHNKFFIFDNKRVWTGSANLTDTDFSDFNANDALLIDSYKLAKDYTKEFEQLYNGRFHTCKNNLSNNETIQLDSNTKINVYFSPQDLIIINQIIKLIDTSQNYVYIPIFCLTSKPLTKSLIAAHNRGVDVKIIIDATNASEKHSIHNILREAGIKVKVENKAGKMHMKTIIIDDKYSVIGSMNFTKSGEKYNDENVLIIENKQLSNYLKTIFLYLWQSIPDKYLKLNPPAESIYSIGSCSDDIDNDFDGKIDNSDNSCSYTTYKRTK